MLKILFSPSEGKNSGGKEASKELLGAKDARKEILNAYNTIVMSRDEEKIKELFGFKKFSDCEAYLNDIFTSPLMFAIKRYKGVAYDYLDIDSLSCENIEYLKSNTIIFSNLYGPILGGDTIANYKVKQGNNIGEVVPDKFYKDRFSYQLDLYLDKSEVLDLRAGYYDKFYKSNKPYTSLKFLKDGKTVSHWAKAYRGLILRELAKKKIKSMEEFMALEIETLQIKEIKVIKNKTEIVYNIVYTKGELLVDDSQEYKDKKAYFEKIITLYGRNVVIEVLQDSNIEVHKLHFASSNKTDGAIKTILSLAKSRNIDITYHEKNSLSRISKNAKQDQGVAIDIMAQTYKSAQEIKNLPTYRLIALDGIQNPQNLGMIIRSCAAGNVDGIILPKKSSAKISPLVIKASAGTLFKLPIYYCNTLNEILPNLKETSIYALSSHAKTTIHDVAPEEKSIFVLGNESDGISPEIEKLCNDSIAIPMRRGLESLNVAVTASLIAFMK
jgi:predicted rRNA methylase